MNKEIFDRFAQGSAARVANIKHAEAFLTERMITEPVISSDRETRRGFHLPRGFTLPLASALVVTVGVLSGCTPSEQQINNAVNTAVANTNKEGAKIVPISATPVISRTEGITRTEAITKTEVMTNTMELPKPAAWDHAPVINLVQATNMPSFPKTAAEAATTFGVDGSTRDPKRWEKTAEGDGWHLSEATRVDDTKDALNVNPNGYLTEGYFDTKPGHNPFAFVIAGIKDLIPAQGVTVWNVKSIDQASKLQKEMATPKWKDGNGNPFDHPVVIIVPNQEQKVTIVPSITPKATATIAKAEGKAIPAASSEYPQTAEKAASLFGGKSNEWKLNPEGVWNFNSNEETTMTLDKVTADGYNKDGPVVATGSNGKVSVKLLGGTFYNLKPTEVQALIDAVRANNPGKQIQVVGVK